MATATILLATKVSRAMKLMLEIAGGIILAMVAFPIILCLPGLVLATWNSSNRIGRFTVRAGVFGASCYIGTLLYQWVNI